MEPRQITPADYEQIRGIYVEASGDPHDVPVAYAANQCHADPEGNVAIEIDRKLVGYACSFTAGSIGYIGNVAVLPEHQGNGYGRAVTKAARDYLKERCEIVGLATDPEKGRNLHLYETCGFVATYPSCRVSKALPADTTYANPNVL